MWTPLRLLALMALTAMLGACSSSHPVSRTLEEWFSPKREGLELQRLSFVEYDDRVRGALTGQMVGIAYAAKVEDATGTPPDEIDLPIWLPQNIADSLRSDELYVQATFLEVIQVKGLAADAEDAAGLFARTAYPLDRQNLAARENVRAGILPPDSGHPRFNPYAGDHQIQNNIAILGLINPGMHQTMAKLIAPFASMTAYGEGYDGGLFVGGMYAASFFHSEPRAIIERGLASLNDDSALAEPVRAVLNFYDNNRNQGWANCAMMVNERFAVPASSAKPYQKGARWSAGIVTTALLFGEGDFERTLQIATQAAQGFDAPAGIACGLIGAMKGYSRIPSEFSSAVPPLSQQTFLGTRHSYNSLVQSSREIAREIVNRRGGRIESLGQRDYFAIPIEDPVPARRDNRYTEDLARELQPEWQNLAAVRDQRRHERLNRELAAWSSGWQIQNCGDRIYTGRVEEVGARRNIFATYPLSADVPCIFTWQGVVPADSPRLDIIVSASGLSENADFTLRVRANEQRLREEVVSAPQRSLQWNTYIVDLAEYAGQEITLTVEHEARRWQNESAFWARLRVEQGEMSPIMEESYTEEVSE